MVLGAINGLEVEVNTQNALERGEHKPYTIAMKSKNMVSWEVTQRLV